ncbi:nitrile hydratase subunit beta [Paenibacillus abyssi]|uniref:nitrile hydratase n=1 Tax=Paenibacillus abyssi TaxID=1340531 RepID=A0A917G4X9_9BACL|nr:nitrile hydratase subunit beta [Paenibacillus abyssi]GGG22480.1 nitrile hydratase [Paenibacillus abyssi]
MKLQQYLGGLEGLNDPIDFDTRVFAEPWEKRIFAIHVSMMGLSNHLEGIQDIPSNFDSKYTWADLRERAESMHPFDYFKFRYYEKWVGGVADFLIKGGYINEEEWDAKTAVYLNNADEQLPSVSEPAIDHQVIEYLRKGDSLYRESDRKPQFSAGETVLVRNNHVMLHTRLPGFVRSQKGVIEIVYEGNYTYPNSTGTDGIGEPMPVYCVRFDPKDIWGEHVESKSMIYVDIYEAYMDKLAQ